MNIKQEIHAVEILQYMICPWSLCVNNRDNVAFMYEYDPSMHFLVKHKIKLNSVYENVKVQHVFLWLWSLVQGAITVSCSFASAG